VQQLAHRPHLSSKALYNCIVFLNQLKLRNEVTDTGKGNDALPLAVSLVNTYFRMFDVAMKKQFDERVGMKSRLLSALLTGINRAHQFLPDKDQGLDDHMDSLYNISHTAAPSASTQALMLLFHVSAGPGVNRSSDSKLKQQDRYYRAVYTKLSMPSFLRGGKHLTMFFNLLYKTMKYDTDSRRVLAFTKRLLCTVAHSNASVTAASLFLLNELMKTHKQIAVCLNEIPVSDSGELSFDPSKREPRAAIVPCGNNQLDSSDVVLPLWEICLTSKHFHPSVAKFATSLGVIEYSGDPLRDFTLAPFLDKFSYKNPKVHKKGKAIFAQRRVETHTNEPVNDPSFLKKQNVDDADKFFHRFFTERARRDDVKDISRQTDDEDSPDEEVFEMLDEREIDQLVSARCLGT
jgi:ribosome biogenesis protein MAK21